MSNQDGPDDSGGSSGKGANSGYFVRARPKSVYSARVLVFDDTDEQQSTQQKPQTNKTTGTTRKSSPEQTKHAEPQQHTATTTSSVYRKTAY